MHAAVLAAALIACAPEAGHGAPGRAKRRVAPRDCRPVTWRAIPVDHAPSKGSAVRFVGFAGGRLVLFEGAEEVRGELYDPARTRWEPVATRGRPERTTDTFREGLARSIPAPLFYRVGDRVVGIITWQDPSNTTRWAGAVLDPARNAWTAMDMRGAPATFPRGVERANARFLFSFAYVAGHAPVTRYADGYVYDVVANRWAKLPGGGAPGERVDAAVVAVPAGDAVVVWGGNRVDPSNGPSGMTLTSLGDGAVLHASGRSWTALPRAGAPSPRSAAYAAGFGGTNVLVWGGQASPARGAPLPWGGSWVADGGVYDLVRGSWRPVSARGAPAQIGGFSQSDGFTFTGTRFVRVATTQPTWIYDPAADAWRTAPGGPQGPLMALDDGRAVGWAAPGVPAVLLAEQRKWCPVDVAKIPLLAPVAGWSPRFAIASAAGEEIVLFGRIDSEQQPPCPRGAPCAAVSGQKVRWEGVALRP